MEKRIRSGADHSVGGGTLNHQRIRSIFLLQGTKTEQGNIKIKTNPLIIVSVELNWVFDQISWGDC